VVPLAPVTVHSVLPYTLAFAAITAAAAQPQPDVEQLMAHVGERVADFYNRAKNVICMETSRVQPVDLDSSPTGFARTVEAELHLEENDQVPGEAVLVRTIRKVNGRAVREHDKKNRAGCTDPNPLSPEPLAFVLPAHRSKYRFKIAGTATDRNRPALMIDFSSLDRRSDPQLMEDAAGHEDCFDWSGHIASRGRIWVDAGTNDVIRVDQRLTGPVDVKVPTLIQRRHHLDSFVVLVRDDVTIRYRTLAFSDPEETLLLPESIETVTVIRGGLQSTRRQHTFSDYRRFVARGKVLAPASAASP